MNDMLPPAALYTLDSPAYVIDIDRLTENLRLLRDVRERAGCRILLAQKAFSMPAVYPLIGEYLDGTTASGLYEARLGAEEMPGKEVHVYKPAYTERELKALTGLADHILFNSFSQWQRFRPLIERAPRKISCGLRINPAFSTQEGHEIYDPCAPGSRLGITRENFRPGLLDGIEGLHFHTLCEQDSDALSATLAAVEEKFSEFLSRMKWLNFGGGHHITRPGYDVERLIREVRRIREKYDVEVILEPGEAVALNAGYLVGHLLDTVENGMTVGILDVSAACHMPDVLEMPYRPHIIGSGLPGEKKYTYRFGGPTCLAGDIIGDYSFDRPLERGETLIFTDMAIYSFVKNNTFNGMPLPALALYSKEKGLQMVKEFGYEDFRSRLG